MKHDARKEGMTLVELMITVVILVVASVATMGVFISSMRLVVQSREMDSTTIDARKVLEKVKTTAYANLPLVFPDNTAVNPALIGGFQSDPGGSNIVSNESITVNYLNTDGTELAVTTANIPDPVLVRLTVSWTGRDRRNYSHTFTTIKTRQL